jgi:tetratricopeptide (TPR) repeat protein
MPGEVLAHWIQADGVYRDTDLAVRNMNSQQSWNGISGCFSPLKGKFMEDRFLTSIYWEKSGLFHFFDGKFDQAAESYRKAIQEGIPAAHLYYALGACLQLQNQPKEAQRYFDKATSLSRGGE